MACGARVAARPAGPMCPDRRSRPGAQSQRMRCANGEGGRIVATATIDRIPEDASFSEVVWSAPHGTPGEALTELLDLAQHRGVDELVGVRVVPERIWCRCGLGASRGCEPSSRPTARPFARRSTTRPRSWRHRAGACGGAVAASRELVEGHIGPAGQRDAECTRPLCATGTIGPGSPSCAASTPASSRQLVDRAHSRKVSATRGPRVHSRRANQPRA